MSRPSLARAALFTSVLPVVLAGCGPSSPKGEPTAPTSGTSGTPSPTPPASSPGGDASTAPKPGPGGVAPISLPGRWTSPKCGARGYVRNLELLDGGRFKAEDRVSPCPPNVACVWSGIVNREGIWTHEAGKITLATDKDRTPPKQGADFPGSLEFPGAELVEVQGGERCSYTKQ